jgi:hypothetical protein
MISKICILGAEMLVRFVLSILLATLSLSAHAKGPYGSIKVGNWSGGGFTNDSTGAFTGCIASAPYKSGITMLVMVGAKVDWRLAFTHRNWNLGVGSTFPIVLTFDGAGPFNVDGRALSNNTVSVEMPDNSTLIRQFRAARNMSAFAQGNLFQFSLDGTSVLLPALVRCVQIINRDGTAAAGNFVVPTEHQASQTKKVDPAPAAGSSLRPESNVPSSPDLQIEAIELASNFILRASLPNAQVLSRSETPISIASNGAAWKSDDAIGFVRIIPPIDGVKGLDVASTVVANDAKDCKGKFASARNSELVDSDVVFRGMSSCEESERTSISQYFIVSRKRGGFVMFSVVSNLKAQEAKNPTRPERNADFRNAALKVVQ